MTSLFYQRYCGTEQQEQDVPKGKELLMQDVPKGKELLLKQQHS